MSTEINTEKQADYWREYPAKLIPALRAKVEGLIATTNITLSAARARMATIAEVLEIIDGIESSGPNAKAIHPESGPCNQNTMPRSTNERANCSAWPNAPGYYWWRGAPSFKWEVIQIFSYGLADDVSRYAAQKMETRPVVLSLQVWKERGPECGEWVKINQPETQKERQTATKTKP